MTKLIFLTLALLAVIFEIVADVLFKEWSINNKNLILGSGIVLYAIGTIFWAYSLKYEDLSKGLTIFTVLNLIAGIAVGILYFKETLSTLNIIGVILGLVSVILLSF